MSPGQYAREIQAPLSLGIKAFGEIKSGAIDQTFERAGISSSERTAGFALYVAGITGLVIIRPVVGAVVGLVITAGWWN